MNTAIKARITKYVSDEPQPGLVQVEITDAFGTKHIVTDKTAIFVPDSSTLNAESSYPMDITIGCELLSEQAHSVVVRLHHHIETDEGVTELTIGKDSLVSE